MSAETERSIDEATLFRIRKNLLIAREVRHAIRTSPILAPRLPLEIGLQLNNNCNLRCTHCFQWGSNGFLLRASASEKATELDINLIEQLLEDTRAVASSIFIWGGEPLAYRNWEKLCALLAHSGRRVVVCTNGTLIIKQLASICSMSEQLELLISLDGPASINDALRGRGTYDKVMEAISELRKPINSYRGEYLIKYRCQRSSLSLIWLIS